MCESGSARRWRRTRLRLVHLQDVNQHRLRITFVSEDGFHAANTQADLVIGQIIPDLLGSSPRNRQDSIINRCGCA